VNFRFSQGSVATQLKWRENCYHSYSDSFLGNLSVKEFWKLVNVRRSYDQKTKWLFFWNTVCISGSWFSKIFTDEKFLFDVHLIAYLICSNNSSVSCLALKMVHDKNYTLLMDNVTTHRSTTYVDAAYCYRRTMVCRSVCHDREHCKNRWTDRDAV